MLDAADRDGIHGMHGNAVIVDPTDLDWITAAIPLGTFDDPHAFTPEVSVWESRMHPWLSVDGIPHHD